MDYEYGLGELMEDWTGYDRMVYWIGQHCPISGDHEVEQ